MTDLALEAPRLGAAAPGRAARLAALVILAVAAATIGGAYVFEYGWGYLPCELCYLQRKPYYVGMPVALVVAAFLPANARWLRGGLALLALIFLVGAGLGIYHAGVEWHFWPGPAGCSGSAATAGNVNDFLNSLNNLHVVSCTDAAWRFLGISLAGWNVLISLALVAVAMWGWRRTA